MEISKRLGVGLMKSNVDHLAYLVNPIRICQVTIHRAWWLGLYTGSIKVMILLTGQEPNWERVEFWVRKAIQVRIN